MHAPCQSSQVRFRSSSVARFHARLSFKQTQAATMKLRNAAREGMQLAATSQSSTSRSSSSNGSNGSNGSSNNGSNGSSSEFFTPGQEAESRQKLFDNIAPVYDQLNDRLSFGLHRVWKRMTVQWSRAKPRDRVLDVCCGSGDLSFLLAEAVGPGGQVVGLDFSSNMLQDAASRQQQRQQQAGGPRYNMQWIQGDALKLPFPQASFDAATIGYGLRNVASIPMALQELHRVLKPGAAVAVLDFNNVQNPVVDSFQGFMLESVVVPAARSLGVAEEYEYLRPSIKRFPTGREQETLALQAGFRRATHYEIAFGLMGVLVATK